MRSAVLKAKYWDVTYRCRSCKVITLRRVTFPEPVAGFREEAMKERKCPECGGKAVYYWAACWAPPPPGFKTYE